jgi:hypothetical protein
LCLMRSILGLSLALAVPILALSADCGGSASSGTCDFTGWPTYLHVPATCTDQGEVVLVETDACCCGGNSYAICTGGSYACACTIPQGPVTRCTPGGVNFGTCLDAGDASADSAASDAKRAE